MRDHHPMFDINPYMPPDVFNAEYPDAKSLPFAANGGFLQKNNRGKRSTASSLNKGSPSSEVHVSRMSKLHTAKTD